MTRLEQRPSLRLTQWQECSVCRQVFGNPDMDDECIARLCGVASPYVRCCCCGQVVRYHGNRWYQARWQRWEKEHRFPVDNRPESDILSP